ncbi:MAG: flagellar biosynthesis/type III secretory pathway protein FliH [Phenylobacterium sp.]|jgi:flagellar biosynthesis/type III secretory pathway protein FliH
MSVLTQIKKTPGQAVKSFALPQVTEPVKPASVVTPTPTKPLVNSNSITADLMTLDKTQREQLLQQLFGDDLNHIVNQEQQKGLAEGQKQAEQQLEAMKNDFAEQQQSLIEGLNDAIKTFSEQPMVVELTDEAILLEIIYSAVLKIINVQLSDGDYISTLVTGLAEEFVGQETWQLDLSSRDCHLIKELKLDSLLPANMKVGEEDNLLPGSYRIHIDGGAIESKLEEKLRQFTHALIETYRGK